MSLASCLSHGKARLSKRDQCTGTEGKKEREKEREGEREKERERPDSAVQWSQWPQTLFSFPPD